MQKIAGVIGIPEVTAHQPKQSTFMPTDESLKGTAIAVALSYGQFVIVVSAPRSLNPHPYSLLGPAPQDFPE